MRAVQLLATAILLASPLLSAGDHSLGLPLASPESVGLFTKGLQKINTTFAKPVAEGKIPGLITVVARQGKIAHFEMHGTADIEGKIPLKPDTIFRIYSMTKPIIGVAMMMLYDEGKFQLDDPVSHYMPAFARMKVYTEQGLAEQHNRITIRHLLTHTSGLADAYMPDPVSTQYKQAGLDAEWSTMTSGITLEQYVDKMTQIPLLFQPGTRWHYGMNLSVVGRLIEIISGQSLGNYLQQQIFQPLGMKDTAYFVDKKKRQRLAPIYKYQNGQLLDISQELAYNAKPSLELGDSGLVSTAIDYLRFSQMLLNKGELEGVRLLRPATVELMFENHLPESLGTKPMAVLKGYPVADRGGMGHGLAAAVVVDAEAAGSEGSNGEYTWGGAAATEFWIDSKERLVGLALTQFFVGWSQFSTREKLHHAVYRSLEDSKNSEIKN